MKPVLLGLGALVTVAGLASGSGPVFVLGLVLFFCTFATG